MKLVHNSHIGVPPKAILEFLCSNREIIIKGNCAGLNYLAELCLKLIKKPNKYHVHLDKAIPGKTVLSKNSLYAVIMISDDFDENM